MIRRSMLFLLSAGLLTSCSKPTLRTVARPSAPLPTRIERLLLWLPAGDMPVDAKKTAAAFAGLLSPLGVVMTVGRSTPLELERGDDQKPLVAAFRPTHRLEIDVEYFVTGSVALTFALKAALYDAKGKDPVRIYVVGQRGDDGTKFVNLIVAKLQADGYLPATNG